jgi:nucleotide-binding universal stress UspA family protein
MRTRVRRHGTLLQARTREVPAEIMAEAEKVGADLIVIGRRGMSEVSEMLLGSVSNKLIHLLGPPVLVAHEFPGRSSDRRAG